MTATDPTIPSTEQARAELVSTLNAIEDKLNVPRKIKRTTDHWGHRLRVLRAENPAALAGIAVGVAVVLGGAVWGIVKVVSRD
ncbi:MAG: hypothetical protein ABWX82_08655 [Leifsonia sp.]